MFHINQFWAGWHKLWQAGKRLTRTDIRTLRTKFRIKSAGEDSPRLVIGNFASLAWALTCQFLTVTSLLKSESPSQSLSDLNLF